LVGLLGLVLLVGLGSCLLQQLLLQAGRPSGCSSLQHQ
jgi:hypothetical protein